MKGNNTFLNHQLVPKRQFFLCHSYLLFSIKIKLYTNYGLNCDFCATKLHSNLSATAKKCQFCKIYEMCGFQNVCASFVKQ